MGRFVILVIRSHREVEETPPLSPPTDVGWDNFPPFLKGDYLIVPGRFQMKLSECNLPGYSSFETWQERNWENWFVIASEAKQSH